LLGFGAADVDEQKGLRNTRRGNPYEIEASQIPLIKVPIPEQA